MSGIKGLTKGVQRSPRLPIIGKLRKGAARTEEDVQKKRPGKDLEWFRFTSDEPGLELLFQQLFGEDPAIITGLLPLETIDECFPTRREARDKAGFLEHACDGEFCEIWRDDKGVIHYAQPGIQGPPCPGKCKPIGRLYLEIPEILRAGYSGWIVCETKALNDIPRIYDALTVIERKRRGSLFGLRGVPVVIRRVAAMVPTPRADGSRVRQEKWLVQLLESPEWAARQAEEAMAGDQRPRWVPQQPDWEDVTQPGKTAAPIQQQEDEFLIGDPQDDEGLQGEEPFPSDEDAPAEAADPSGATDSIEGWLADFKALLQEKGKMTGVATNPQAGKIAGLLKKCWPEIDDDESLNVLRRQACQAILGHRLSDGTTKAEASTLIEMLSDGNSGISPVSSRIVRELVKRAQAQAGQKELFPEEVLL